MYIFDSMFRKRWIIQDVGVQCLTWKLISRSCLSQRLGMNAEIVLMSRGRFCQNQSNLKCQKEGKGNHSFKRRQPKECKLDLSEIFDF
ncbi:X antigen family member 5 isoform X2 [Gorilla gorilla gorilla]|uniref:X antigen family member 5 isoform X2 n=1 Tax=Gorilla gorilla gorilla TaxID=9595 RepID=UPI002446097F|nr:X antigen family member 5 isoform X3 [Gorilla gorilla gorilla]